MCAICVNTYTNICGTMCARYHKDKGWWTLLVICNKQFLQHLHRTLSCPLSCQQRREKYLCPHFIESYLIINKNYCRNSFLPVVCKPPTMPACPCMNTDIVNTPQCLESLLVLFFLGYIILLFYASVFIVKGLKH